jgi:ATP-dependent RNA helicase DDX24/MAK5
MSNLHGDDARKRKRRRVDDPKKGNVVHKKPKGKVVELSTLKWRKVEMPDRLEDVEGFYGLDEIDGVDVVRLDNGKVEFRVSGRDP